VTDRSLGLRMMLVAGLSIVIILRLVFHIYSTLLFPLFIVLAILFLVLIVGSRMATKR